MVCNKIIYISMWDGFPSLGIYLHARYTNEEKSDPALMFFVCTCCTDGMVSHMLIQPAVNRVGNFRQKNYSAEDGIDGTITLFRQNSGRSSEQKTLGIPFRTIPQRRKMLGILYHGTNIEANSRNSVLNHSAEEKTTRNPVSWNKNRSKHLEFCSEPFRGRENNSEFRSVEQKEPNSRNSVPKLYPTKTFCVLEQDFCTTNFFIPFPSVPSLGIDSFVNTGVPRNEHFLPRNE
jgi:hypothetical protein